MCVCEQRTGPSIRAKNADSGEVERPRRGPLTPTAAAAGASGMRSALRPARRASARARALAAAPPRPPPRDTRPARDAIRE